MDWYGAGIYWCRIHAGLRILCFGHSIRGVCNGMLWRRKCHLQRILRIRDEIHRKITYNGVGGRCAFRTNRVVPDLETTSEQSDHILHSFRIMGSWRRCLANAS